MASIKPHSKPVDFGFIMDAFNDVMNGMAVASALNKAVSAITALVDGGIMKWLLDQVVSWITSA
jgi:hypothetical protein